MNGWFLEREMKERVKERLREAEQTRLALSGTPPREGPALYQRGLGWLGKALNKAGAFLLQQADKRTMPSPEPVERAIKAEPC
jgi:hypothetical protein